MKEKWIKHAEAQRGINVDFYEGAKVKKRYVLKGKSRILFFLNYLVLIIVGREKGIQINFRAQTKSCYFLQVWIQTGLGQKKFENHSFFTQRTFIFSLLYGVLE